MVFISLNNIPATKYMQAYICIFQFSFICVQIEHEILLQNFSVTARFALSLDTEPKKCLLMKIEILGLAAASLSLDSWKCLLLENNVKIFLNYYGIMPPTS